MAVGFDDDIQELVDIVDRFAGDISDKLSEMAFAADSLQLLLYRSILRSLSELSRELANWANNYFAAIPDGIREELAPLLEVDPVDVVAEEKRKFLLAFGAAVTAVRSLASRMSKGQFPSRGISAKIREIRTNAQSKNYASDVSIARTEIRKLLHEGLVQITGRNGRTYSYDFAYHQALHAHQAKQTAIVNAAISAIRKRGDDLVQVSPQPSTIGDFCDLYRGKVFSLSGTDRFFHPISIIPNGGCPMHPWCRHTLLPFDTSGYLQSDLEKLQKIPEAFIELGKQRANANAFQKLWLGS